LTQVSFAFDPFPDYLYALATVIFQTPMSAETPTLDDLRREIDEIDIAVHDLLMRRMALADRIAHAKGETTGFIRPGREALILRRLIARHHGPFPKVVVARIWREIISAMTALEGPFTVAVHAPEATVGVLPLPRGEETDPWWRSLTRQGADVPKIIARLPFAAVSRRFDGQEALAVALAAPEASGKDRSLLVIENRGQLSRGAFKTAMSEAGFEVVDLQSWSADGETPLALVEVEGFFSPEDARVARLSGTGDSPFGHAWLVGGYAVPFSVEELVSDPAQETG
jgi:chorismate mutase